MIVIKHPTKKDTRTGKDMQCIITYARHEGRGVKSVKVGSRIRTVGGVECYFPVTFYFNDGAKAVTAWSNWRVLADWLRSRRSWGLVDIQGGAGVLHRYHGLAGGAPLKPWQKRIRRDAGIYSCPCGCGAKI